MTLAQISDLFRQVVTRFLWYLQGYLHWGYLKVFYSLLLLLKDNFDIILRYHFGMFVNFFQILIFFTCGDTFVVGWGFEITNILQKFIA